MRREGEAGYTLVMLMAAITIMLITMGLGVPFWRYVVKDDREQELLFRGGEIADAIAAYQQKNANAPPPTLQVLVEQRFLRRLYTDPMSESGEWRMIRPGEAIVPGQPGGPGGPLTGEATPTPTPRPASVGATGQGLGQGRPGQPGTGAGGLVGGGILGVASTSTDKSFRLLNGKDRYDQWLFIAGQPRIVGAQVVGPVGPTQGGGPGGGGQGAPGLGPTPLPKPDPSGRSQRRR